MANASFWVDPMVAKIRLAREEQPPEDWNTKRTKKVIEGPTPAISSWMLVCWQLTALSICLQKIFQVEQLTTEGSVLPEILAMGEVKVVRINVESMEGEAIAGVKDLLLQICPKLPIFLIELSRRGREDLIPSEEQLNWLFNHGYQYVDIHAKV